MSSKSQSNRPRPSERRTASGAAESHRPPTPLRKYYLAAALFFFIGDVLAISTESAVSVVVFTILMLMMLWISWRVDRVVENRRPSDRPGAKDSA